MKILRKAGNETALKTGVRSRLDSTDSQGALSIRPSKVPRFRSPDLLAGGLGPIGPLAGYEPVGRLNPFKNPQEVALGTDRTSSQR